MADQKMQVRVSDNKPLILRDKNEWLRALQIVTIAVPGYEPDELKVRGAVTWRLAQDLAPDSEFTCGLRFPDINLDLVLEHAESGQDAAYAFPES